MKDKSMHYNKHMFNKRIRETWLLAMKVHICEIHARRRADLNLNHRA